MPFQPSDTLKSKTYLGLILSQLLAAFNDQASHIVAIFYATDLLVHYVGLAYVDETTVISVVTACFIAPFLFFSTLAGMLADKFSKRSILIFWKLAEVAIMGLGLVGFVLPHLGDVIRADPQTLALWSAGLVVAVVFLMGTHSAFFVPAKYGVMPEILQPTVLSRGNGFLEATSFMAQILGTAFGGFLYGSLKSQSEVFEPGQEWIIGLILLILAVLGAAASFLIAPIPAAAPERPLTWKLWRPLRDNVAVLLRSRPLALAVLGIAFFTFMTLFLRQTLLYDGETQKELHMAQRRLGVVHEHSEPPHTLPMSNLPSSKERAEFKVALLLALVGLGVGIGSPLAGILSGNKVELGLVPLGATALALITALFGFLNFILPVHAHFERTCWLVGSLAAIGMAASFYIVPLYTLLQHRAPKESKGNLVATSNFVNVAGGLLAVGVFYVLTVVLEHLFGLSFSSQDVEHDPAKYKPLLERQAQLLPSAHFFAASLFTVGMLVLLCRQLPDFFVRALLWLRSHGRYRLKVVGMKNLPSDGPVILATNCDRFESCMQVLAATDRYTRFILLESAADPEPRPLLRFLARRTGLIALKPGTTNSDLWNKALRKAVQTLETGNLLAITVDSEWPAADVDRFLDRLRAGRSAVVLPIFCGGAPARPSVNGQAAGTRRVHVLIGQPLPADASPDIIRQHIRQLGDRLHEAELTGASPVEI